MSSRDPLFDSDHRRLDRRSLALHEAVAAAIRRDPAVIEHALDNLSRWGATVSGSWIDEWWVLLRGSRDALLAFLVEQSEHADRLRQSSPFTGVLSDDERRRIIELFSVERTNDP